MVVLNPIASALPSLQLEVLLLLFCDLSLWADFELKILWLIAWSLFSSPLKFLSGIASACLCLGKALYIWLNHSYWLTCGVGILPPKVWLFLGWLVGLVGHRVPIWPFPMGGALWSPVPNRGCGNGRLMMNVSSTDQLTGFIHRGPKNLN